MEKKLHTSDTYGAMQLSAILVLMVLTVAGTAFGKFDRASLSTKAEKLLDTRNGSDFQINAVVLQKEGLLRQVYLYEMEKGLGCDPTNLSKLDRVGGTATIDDYLPDFNLQGIYVCPSFNPLQFCSTSDKADCLSGYFASFGMTLADFPAALKRARVNGKKVGPTKDEKIGGEMQMMYQIRWFAHAYPTYFEFLKGAEAKCVELDAESCNQMANLHTLRDVGRSTIKPVVKELTAWKKLGPNKSLTKMIQKYPGLWK